MDMDSSAKIDLLNLKISRFIEETVMHVCETGSAELFKFAYELRKFDTQEKYSKDFLNGQVRPDILVKIICSNKWNDSKKKMEAD